MRSDHLVDHRPEVARPLCTRGEKCFADIVVLGEIVAVWDSVGCFGGVTCAIFVVVLHFCRITISGALV